jgi:hypothetical protein
MVKINYQQVRMVRIRTRGRIGKVKQQGASSSQGPTKQNRVAKGASMDNSRFKYLCSDDKNQIAKEIKGAVRSQRKIVSKEEIVHEVKDWVEDPQNTGTRETKYFHLPKTY